MMIDPSTRRVVITGMGLVSPLGNDPVAFWNALTSGTSGVRRLESIPIDYLPIQCGAEALEFTGRIEDFGPLEPNQKKTIRKGLKVMCREIQMGVAASQRALSDAGLKFGSIDGERAGVVYGSDYIMTKPSEFTDGIRSCLNDRHEFEFSQWAEHGLTKVTPLWLLKYLPNMPACHVAIYNDFRGPNNSITVREASSNLALAEAYCTIARGNADLMVSGATGSRVQPIRTIHVALQEELATGNGNAAALSRPFDLHRSGMVVGEGAAAMVLEEYESAQTRGANILAEIVGYGSSTVIDRRSIARRGQALVNAMRQALRSAGMTPDEIGHLHAHGAATRQSDVDEAMAIKTVFGDRKEPVPVEAAKSYFGNLGAASGVIELMSSVLALRHGKLFPVLNYETPDPECPIAVVRTSEPAGGSVLNVNVTPQGQASAVIVRLLS